MSYRTLDKCRACGGTDLPMVFDLGVQPLANDHCKPGEPRQGFYPLAVLYCNGCGLAQLSAVVDKEILYRNYSYVTSSSETMKRHFNRLIQDIESEKPERKLLEIGSNDGTLLSYFQGLGYDVQGIDPAKNLAAIANSHGVMTVPTFFDRESALPMRGNVPLILARHCFAHMDDWDEFFRASEMVSTNDCLLCLEVPYVGDMLQRAEFDTIYHEHLSYISLKPVAKCAERFGWRLHRVIKYMIHGGAILIMFRRKDNPVQANLSADEYLADENITLDAWKKFEGRAGVKIMRLRETVNDLADKGKLVCAFGASAKATVLIHACGFTKRQIAFVTDNSPFKPGRLVPGTDIPIIEESQMLSEHPDYAVCSAWNYRGEILEKMSKWRSRGGKFIFPHPEVEIV